MRMYCKFCKVELSEKEATYQQDHLIPGAPLACENHKVEQMLHLEKMAHHANVPIENMFWEND